jgi:hypothetical protein
MKQTKPSPDWSVLFEHLSGATERPAERSNRLDLCDLIEWVCDDAKRIEMDLCILEGRLREVRRLADYQNRLSA